MMGLAVLRGALQAFAIMFGSFGMFFLILSCLQPAYVGYAVLFTGVASAIVWAMPQT